MTHGIGLQGAKAFTNGQFYLTNASENFKTIFSLNPRANMSDQFAKAGAIKGVY